MCASPHHRQVRLIRTIGIAAPGWVRAVGGGPGGVVVAAAEMGAGILIKMDDSQLVNQSEKWEKGQ